MVGVKHKNKSRDHPDLIEYTIFGQYVALQQGHLAAMPQAADLKRKAKTAEDMRRQIKQICEWLQVSYSEYCEEGGVIRLTPDQLLDPSCASLY